jgi:tRNA(Ile)-lysidine synthetase, N-terminal domain/tRNA(Ile)-lysidine synthetase, C-terminal domain
MSELDLLDRVVEITLRYNMFANGSRVGVAVSGGADSVCLLHVLRELAPRWNLHLVVLHLNHQLRGEESDADARFVRNLAESLGLPYRERSVDAARVSAETGDNLEQAARRLRSRFFQDCRKELGLDRIATGHTLSDQAETVLFRLLRGSGPTGLAGIRPITLDGLARPLLRVDRSDVERYLQDRGQPWREDRTNVDRTFVRNRIRHDLLPALTRDYNPNLASALARMAELAQEDEEYWTAELARLGPKVLRRRGPLVLFRCSDLPESRAVSKRLLRLAIETVRGDLRQIELAHVEQLLALARQPEGAGRLMIPGVDAFRSFDWIRLAPPGFDAGRPRDYEAPLTVPGKVVIPGGSVVLEVLPAGPERTRNTHEIPATGKGFEQSQGFWDYNEKQETDLDWDRVAGPLTLRNWRPSDQYRPQGRSGREKVKTLFQEAKIPLWDRRHWPVIVAGDRIVWVRQFGPDDEFAATLSTRSLLRVRFLPDPQ